MGTVYNGYSLGGMSGGGGMEEITSFTWSWSKTSGAQWVTADLSNYEWVVLSFIPNASYAPYQIRYYWAIPVGGDNVGVAWRFSESPSTSTRYDYAACMYVYATTSGIYLYQGYYDNKPYLEPQSNTVQLYGIR